MKHIASVFAVVIAVLVSGTLKAQQERQKPVHFKRAVLVTIGIENFGSALIPPVTYGEADAIDMSKMFSERYAFESVELIGKAATRTGILAQLRNLSKELSENDAIVVYMATHGEVLQTSDLRNHGFLLTYDSNLELDPNQKRRVLEMPVDEGQKVVAEWQSKSIAMSELASIVREMKARHRLLLVDACYSGQLVPRSITSGAIPQLLNRSSATVIAAATANQQALPSEREKNGIFTASLLRNLKSRDALCLTEVFLKVRDEVAAESGNQMLPLMAPIGGDGGEFVFLPKNIAPDDVTMVLKGVSDRVRGRGLFPAETTVQNVIRAFTATDYRYAKNATQVDMFWKKEFELRRNAATLGDPLAMAVLHYCYSTGLGTTKSPELAAEWGQRCFDTGEAVGMHIMGRMLLNGIGRDKEPAYGRSLIEEAQGKGFPLSRATEAFLILGDRPIKDLSMEEFEHIRKLAQAAANDGVPIAWRLLGLLAFNGCDGIAADPEAVLRHFEKASNLGDDASKLMIVEACSGNGLPSVRNIERAKENLFAAVDAGLPRAMLLLANELYFGNEKSMFGLDLGTDLPRSRRLSEMASELGNTQAMVLYGELAENGVGGPVDLTEAKRLIELAAELGEPTALAKQGMWYLHGGMYVQDAKKAFAAFKQAASLRNADGCRMLGLMYEDGIGFDLQGADRLTFKHHALHWYATAHRISRDKTSADRLLDFRGQLNVVRTGIPWGEAIEPPVVYSRWKKAYAETADYFEKEFPGPKVDGELNKVVVLDTQSDVVGFGNSDGQLEPEAASKAKQRAIESAVSTLKIAPDEPKSMDRAINVSERVLTEGIVRSISWQAPTGVWRSVCIVIWPRETLIKALEKDGIKTGTTSNEKPAGLFAEDLDKLESTPISENDRRGIKMILDQICNQAIETDRGKKPDLRRNQETSDLEANLNGMITVNTQKYEQWVNLLKPLVVRCASRAATFRWRYKLNEQGEVSIVWPHDRPSTVFRTGTLDFRSYLPDEIQQWPAVNGLEAFYIIEKLTPTGEDNGEMSVLFCMIPSLANLSKPKQAEIRAKLFDAQAELVSSTSDIDDFGPVMAGRVELLRTPGVPRFAAPSASSLFCAPLFGTDVFVMKQQARLHATINLNPESAKQVADWGFEVIK